MDHRVQRLDAPVHDFREACLFRYLDDFEARLAELPAGAAGREYFDAEFGKPLYKRNEVALVGDTDERASCAGFRG